MYKIDKITSDPKQLQTFLLSDGSQISLQIEYKDVCLGWFITSLQYKDVEIKGIRIVTSPNMLHQFKNIIPFGLCCLTDKNQEPTTINDFVNGRSTLYILSQDDVNSYEDYLRA